MNSVQKRKKLWLKLGFAALVFIITAIASICSVRAEIVMVKSADSVVLLQTKMGGNKGFNAILSRKDLTPTYNYLYNKSLTGNILNRTYHVHGVKQVAWLLLEPNDSRGGEWADSG